MLLGNVSNEGTNYSFYKIINCLKTNQKLTQIKNDQHTPILKYQVS